MRIPRKLKKKIKKKYGKEFYGISTIGYYINNFCKTTLRGLQSVAKIIEYIKKLNYEW